MAIDVVNNVDQNAGNFRGMVERPIGQFNHPLSIIVNVAGRNYGALAATNTYSKCFFLISLSYLWLSITNYS